MPKTNHLEKVMGWIVGGIITFGILCASYAALVHPLSDITRTGLLNIALACAAALAGAMNIRPQSAQETPPPPPIASPDAPPAQAQRMTRDESPSPVTLDEKGLPPPAG
jgi:hypothetical protein